MKIKKDYVDKINKKDVHKQVKMIQKSKQNYKKNIYTIREKIPSFKSKESPHIKKAKKIYNIQSIKPSQQLAQITKCHINGLKQIVSKGKGAYYSSGSRPSQTPESWGIARLASSLTGGKSSGIDLDILLKYCKKNAQPLKLAQSPSYSRRPSIKKVIP